MMRLVPHQNWDVTKNLTKKLGILKEDKPEIKEAGLNNMIANMTQALSLTNMQITIKSYWYSILELSLFNLYSAFPILILSNGTECKSSVIYGISSLWPISQSSQGPIKESSSTKLSLSLSLSQSSILPLVKKLLVILYPT